MSVPSHNMNTSEKSHRMRGTLKIFGAALDPLSSPERLNLKLAYINFTNKHPDVDKNSDPYDVMRKFLIKEMPSLNRNVWFGKLEIESWLTPKPKFEHIKLLNSETFSNFLRRNGCWDYALRVSNYVNKKILPSIPVMIGVDHSLTGGVIMGLSKYYKKLNVIVLDAHFDALQYQDVNPLSQLWLEGYCHSNRKPKKITYYECGNFISYLIAKKIISPKNLWVLGIQDGILESWRAGSEHKKGERAQIEEYKSLVERGVHLISKTDLVCEKFFLKLNGPIYLSIDMDVGSLSSIYSARFMNCFGLTRDEFIKTLYNLSRAFRKSGFPLVGLDIMETDIHLLEASKSCRYQDYSREIVRETFQAFFTNRLN